MQKARNGVPCASCLLLWKRGKGDNSTFFVSNQAVNIDIKMLSEHVCGEQASLARDVNCSLDYTFKHDWYHNVFV